MNTYEVITARRSTREFTGEKVSETALQKILAAGSIAPVGAGQYNGVHFTVVESGEAIDKVRSEFKKMFPGKDLLYGAPLFIVVSAKPTEQGTPFASMEYANAGCIIENMMLAATEEGLGNCYIWGATLINRSDELKSYLGIPDGFKAVSGVVIGHTETPVQKKELSVTVETNRI